MRTRKFKTLRGWLDYIYSRHMRAGNEVYETLTDFFGETWHFYYFTDFATTDERWHDDYVSVPWEEKLPIARTIVDYHWSRKPKYERERIAEALAKGCGDLSYLQSFQVSIKKEDGKWTYKYCTCSLSGPNYDWCRRKYLQSI